jgi:hypothetical protein
MAQSMAHKMQHMPFAMSDEGTLYLVHQCTSSNLRVFYLPHIRVGVGLELVVAVRCLLRSALRRPPCLTPCRWR